MIKHFEEKACNYTRIILQFKLQIEYVAAVSYTNSRFFIYAFLNKFILSTIKLRKYFF